MRERILSEFDERENNSIFNILEKPTENIIEKTNISDQDDSQNMESSLNSYDNYTFNSSTYLEEDKDKSIYASIHNCKDFLMMLSLLVCPSFNFNYLYLPPLLIGFIYIRFILKNEMVFRRRKSHFEAAVFIYSAILLIFKLIIIILATKENDSIKNSSSVFIDLGVYYLISDDTFSVIKTLFGESVIIISCICSFIIRKFFSFDDQDLNKKKEKDYEENNLNNFFSKMIKYLFLSFFIIVGFSTCNKSVLSLCYLIFFYCTLILYSLIPKRKVYYIIKGIMLTLIIFLLFQILILNISNVYSIAYKYFDPKIDKMNKNFLEQCWPKIGFYFAYYDDDKMAQLFEDWTGYIFGCLSLVIITFIYKDISLKNFIQAKNKKKQQNGSIAFVKQQNCIIKFIKKFLNFFSGPYFVLNLVRILSITWIYFYRNFYSVGAILWLFFSFLDLNVEIIRYLAVIILLPTIFISLVSINGSRIFDSLLSDLDDISKIKYMHFSLGSYSYDYLRFIAVNIFFCFIICFISLLNKNRNKMEDMKIPKKDDNLKEENELEKNLLYDENEPMEIKNDIKENEKNELIDLNIKNTINEIEEKNNFKENIKLEEIIQDNNINNKLTKISLSNIIKKNIFVNIDKITLVVMYFVANKTINIIHFIFVIIFMIQLLTPHYIKKLCSFIIILFQFLFFGEYIMDLLKVYFKESFKNNLSMIQFFLVYDIGEDNDSLSQTQIEIFIYGIIYCFYIHYQLYNNEYYQKLTLDKNIKLSNHIEDNLSNKPIIKKILYFIGNIIVEVYIWILISCFIFFTCYFEINVLFAGKTLLFLLSAYQFCIFIQNHKDGKGKMDLKLSKLLLIYSGLNTFIVYNYQLINLEVTGIKNEIQKSENFIIKNLPNIGLTIYKDENLYYNLLPHFFMNFLSLLYLWEMKRMSENFNKNIIEENNKKNKLIILSNDIDKNIKEKKEKKEENDIFDIKNNNIIEDKEEEEEENEKDENEKEDPKIGIFEKYNSNKVEMRLLNVKYFFLWIILSFTKLYWLFLFITTCIIYTTQDISAGIFIYIFIFGITFIAMFYSLINTLNNFIKKDSYFISKVIRYYLIEKKQHILKNKYFRSISFRFLLGYSLLLLFLFYLYGVYDLFQHGCNEEIFRGCDSSHMPILENIEDYFVSISYLLGFYIDIRKIGILTSSWFHLLFSALIAFDVYIQKIENYCTSCSVVNRRKYQKLKSENTKLKALISSGNDNFIFNIGSYLKKNNDDNNISPFSFSNSFNSSYNLSISKMSNINDYDEIFNKINTVFDTRRLNISEEEENLGKKYIIQFLEAFRKASTKDVSLSEKKNKYKIIKAIKAIFEEIIISLLLCNAITKINIWSFIYILISIYLISSEKTMMKYYAIFCFLIFSIFTQVNIFISNLTKETDPTPNYDILDVINSTLHIPWYEKSKKMGFFFGLGVTKYQINLIWMDFIEIVVIYIYLDYFSYSIYQDVENKGSKRKGVDRINYYNLHLDKRVNNCVRNMTERQFNRIHDCMIFDLDIDIGTFDTFRNKILLDSQIQLIQKNFNSIREEKDKRIQSEDIIEIDNDISFNNDDIINTDSKSVVVKKNPLLKFVNTSKSKELSSAIEKKPTKKEKIKLKKESLLDNLYELSYLSFHNIILIIIVIISMMISGLLSLFYITFALYFIMTSDKMYLGQKYYYPKAIKKILRIAILIDIIVQIIYQTPILSIDQEKDKDKDNLLIKILDIIGFNKIINYGQSDDTNIEIYNQEMILVIAKAVSYFFMGIQILIYSSEGFQEHYLSYIITREHLLRKVTLMNVFRFNNRRMEVMNYSLKLREEMSLSMSSLQKILESWHNKLLGMDVGDDMDSEESQKSNDINNNINNDINDDINNDINNDSNENQDNKINERGEKIFSKDEVRKNIKKWILNKKLIKLEKWLYRYCVDYSKISNEEKEEYEINIIQGNNAVKTFIEKEVDFYVSKLDVGEYTEKEMKYIEKYFDGTIEAEMKKIEKQNKLEKKKQLKQRREKYLNKINEDFDKKIKLLDDELKGDDFLKDEKVEKKVEKKLSKKAAKKKEKEEEIKMILNEPKFKIFEKFIKSELFQKYLKTSFILQCILKDLITYASKKFHFLCYLVMIINHMATASLLSVVYPLSIFCYAIFEYPRPTQKYWIFCKLYSIGILCIKCMLQLKLLVVLFDKTSTGIDGKPINLYLDTLENLEYYKIGLKYTESTFSIEFFKYIFYDALVIIFLLINNFLLINKGLLDKREQEIENIYFANDRIAKTKDLNREQVKQLSKIYLSVNYPYNIIKINEQKNEQINKNKGRLSFLQKIKKAKNNKKKIDENEEKENEQLFKSYANLDSLDENNKKYYERLFPKVRNEKPGNDFYYLYTISLILAIIFVVLFYTTMIQDVTFNALAEDTNQFSSDMIICLLIHIVFLFYDRIVYINQNRKNLKYNYILYDKETKEILSEKKFNEMKTQISREYYKLKRDYFMIPHEYAEKLRKKYNIVTIQNEEFNRPLLQKYILHVFIVLFSHAFIFFYSPMKGNYNLNRRLYCLQDDEVCNDFNKNITLFYFYIIYIFYYLFSGLQVKFGFYDMKRKSLLKSVEKSFYGTINTIFRSIPFVYEIKLAIDWTFTATCLDFFQWNKYESVYDTVYTTFTAMNYKNISKVGQKIGKSLKIGMGATISFGLIILIIAPILLFSSLNPTNVSTIVKSGTLTVELSFVYKNGAMKNYTLFENTKPESVGDLTQNSQDWEKYNYSKSINTKNFPKDQIRRIEFSNTSDTNWGLANPHIQNLIEILQFQNVNETDLRKINIIFDYKFNRELPVEARVTGDRREIEIYDISQGIITNDSDIGKLKNAISNCYDETIILENFYSAPIRLTANPLSKIIEDEYIGKIDVFLGFTNCKNLSEEYVYNSEMNLEDNIFFSNDMNHSYLESYFVFGINNTHKGIIFHTFSDKVSSTTSGYSILTFYVSFILLVGTYVRNFFAGQPSKITLTEMPNCKEIINLCEGIRVSRNSYDFEQEEKLYYILMELMRSPDYLRYLTESSVEQFNKRKMLSLQDDDTKIKN